MSDSPPEWWYDPPELHEIDLCDNCHNGEYHNDDIEYWIKQGCELCKELFEKDSLN